MNDEHIPFRCTYHTDIYRPFFFHSVNKGGSFKKKTKVEKIKFTPNERIIFIDTILSLKFNYYSSYHKEQESIDCVGAILFLLTIGNTLIREVFANLTSCRESYHH